MVGNLSDILAIKRIVICVGSGGVGKTTTAAAIAMAAACSGRRTLVITIDPAKRLANSLGLHQLGHEIQQVADELLDVAAPRQPGGELWAMMLDQKQAFDEVVRRYATDPAAIERILANPVYSQISSSLTGSQEYAALAKLHELDSDGDWDLIVVDTPPTSHALDFLDAPQKLTQAIDSPIVDWFRKLRHSGTRRRWSVAGRTGAYVLKRISKFVGSQFLDDLSVFFTEFNDILGGFRQRAEAVFALLRQEKVGFVLVASPEPMAVDEALFFYARLVASSMPFAAFIVNKVHTDCAITSPAPEITQRLASLPGVSALGLDRAELDSATALLMANHAGQQELALADLHAIERLRQAAGTDAILASIPFFAQDVHDIRGLARIGDYLFPDGATAWRAVSAS